MQAPSPRYAVIAHLLPFVVIARLCTCGPYGPGVAVRLCPARGVKGYSTMEARNTSQKYELV